MGNANTEAFAHLVLCNNWKAWLLNCRQELGGMFQTMYDKDATPGDKTLLDIILPDTEFVPTDLQGDEFVVKDFVLYRGSCSSAQRFKEAVGQRIQALAPVIVSCKGDETFQKAIEGINTIEESAAGQEERRRKKRRLVNDIKQYTSKSSVEESARATGKKAAKFKGWSDEGHKFMVEKAKAIKADMKRKSNFEEAFRFITNANKDSTEEEKYEVDRDAVWDFD